MSRSGKGPKKRRNVQDRWREKLSQSKADREVRENWLAKVHGERADMELLAGDTSEAEQARAAVLRADEVPDGVTDSMLRAACQRALEAM